MALRVYNTLTRKKEDFKPVHAGKVGMYVCGPTVYKPSHVGHMVGPVIFDTVKRYLTYLGYQVTFVVNITDIDDKIIHEANAQKRDWKELAESITADYLDNLKRLNVAVDEIKFPRATDYIDEIKRLIQGLIDKGYAYPSGGDVYFDVTKDPDYGKLCHRDPEQMEAGARIEVSDKKRNPGDFALWKGAKPGEPSWESPWGPGRPGWHIECSTMSMKLLGQTLDIHGGGLDLQFPHHENELAQSESLTGQTFARYWMHNGLMKTGQQKMSKSAGNEIVVREVLKRHDPETVRFLLLSTHYRSPIEYSEERLIEVRKALEGFYRFFERYQRITGESFYGINAPKSEAEDHEVLNQYRQQFNQFENEDLPQNALSALLMFMHNMNDDFNTGGAIGGLNILLRELNRYADEYNLENSQLHRELHSPRFKYGALVLRELAQILGLFWEPPTAKEAGQDELVGGLMQLLIDLRAEARKAKNFAMADQIRKRLGELGVTLEDRPGGTGWRRG
jgi:cysteinyl-tRNA synthetase